MEKVGEVFAATWGKGINFLYRIKIFYTGTREFDNVLAIYLSI